MAKHAIFLSGPIGSGKTTLGRGLAARLSGGFVDGDDLSDPDRPWYCSILQTSRAIVHHASMIMDNSMVVVVAYPLGCMNWIYFRRRIAEVGATPLFVSLRASYSAIVDEQRGRLFDVKEHERIKIMIAEVSCCRFRGHRDRVFFGTGGRRCNDGSSAVSSSSRR